MTFVYILTNPSFTPVKLGYTGNLKQRLGILNSSVPTKFNVHYKHKVDYPRLARRIAREVHKDYSEYRADNGEFFNVLPDEAAVHLYHTAKRMTMEMEMYN